MMLQLNVLKALIMRNWVKEITRARLSRPLLRGRGKYGGRGDLRPWHMPMHGPRASWGRVVLHGRVIRGTRVSTRLPPIVGRGFRRPAALRDRRAVMALSPRGRPTAPPSSRSFDRRPPVPSYSKSTLKRYYGRPEEILPPRSRAIAEYPSRIHSDRRASYRDGYFPPGSNYPALPRGTHSSARRAYVDGGYGQRFERPPTSYREGRGREYDSLSGAKRPYTAVDDVHPRYAEAGVRHSRAHLDYEVASGSVSQYGDAYGDRCLTIIVTLIFFLFCNQWFLLTCLIYILVDLGDQILDMVAIGAPFLVKIPIGCIAVVRVWGMVEVECSRPAMEVITCLVAAMLTQFILVVVWVAVVIWEVVVLDLTTKI